MSLLCLVPKTCPSDATVTQNFTAESHWMLVKDQNKFLAFLAPSCSVSALFRTGFLRLWDHLSQAKEQLSNQWAWLSSGLCLWHLFFPLPGLGNIVDDGSEVAQEPRCNLRIQMTFCVIHYPRIFHGPTPSPQWSPFLHLFMALSLVLKIYLILIRLYINWGPCDLKAKGRAYEDRNIYKLWLFSSETILCLCWPKVEIIGIP